MTHPPFVDWNMTVTKELGADGYTVTRTVEGCDDFQDAQLDKTLGAAGYTVSYTPDGCADEEGEYTGPLDLVPGAVFAYSVRPLSAARIGQNVFRLQRDSDNEELDFVGYADIADLVTATTTWLGGANGTVVTWYDQSGSGYDFVVDGGSPNPPAYTNNLQNNIPGFIGDGNNNFTNTDSITFPNGAVSQFGFHAIGFDGVTDGISYSFDSGAGNDYFLSELGASGMYIDLFSGGADEYGAQFDADPSPVLAVVDLHLSAATRVCRINGVSQALTDFGTGTVVSFASSVAFFRTRNLGASEFFIYPSLINDANSTLIRSNITDFFT